MAAKRGSALPQAKLDEATAARILRLYRRKQRLVQQLNARYSAAAIARREGLHRRTVEKLVARDSWAHIKD